MIPFCRRRRGALIRPLAVPCATLDRALLGGRTPFEGPFELGTSSWARWRMRAMRRRAAGDRVVASFQISCGSASAAGRASRAAAARCRRGDVRPGGRGRQLGRRPCDLVRCRSRADAVPRPGRVGAGSIARRLRHVVDGWRTVGPTLAEHPGAPVLVAARPASALRRPMRPRAGRGRVDYLDKSTDRLALASAFGANPVEGPPPRRAGRYPVTVDASGDQAGLACALRSTEPGGTLHERGDLLRRGDPCAAVRDVPQRPDVQTGRPDLPAPTSPTSWA